MSPDRGEPDAPRVDVAAVLREATGFLRTLDPQVQRSSREGVLLRLDAAPHLFNHLAGPHAAVIFGLGETAAFCLLLEIFGDLVRAGAVPLVKDAQISYAAIATGPLLAAAVLLDNERSARARFEQRGRASFAMEVVFRREVDSIETARCRYTMALLGPSGAQQ